MSVLFIKIFTHASFTDPPRLLLTAAAMYHLVHLCYLTFTMTMHDFLSKGITNVTLEPEVCSICLSHFTAFCFILFFCIFTCRFLTLNFQVIFFACFHHNTDQSVSLCVTKLQNTVHCKQQLVHGHWIITTLSILVKKYCHVPQIR